MIRQGFGRIINLSSQAGFVALPTESVYCASKAAVVAPDPVPGRRVGQPRHHRQRRGADVHPHAGHRARPRRPAFRGRRRRAHRRAAPDRRANRCRRRGRVPRLAGRRPDHRHDADGRRRLDRPLGPTCRPSSPPGRHDHRDRDDDRSGVWSRRAVAQVARAGGARAHGLATDPPVRDPARPGRSDRRRVAAVGPLPRSSTTSSTSPGRRRSSASSASG